MLDNLSVAVHEIDTPNSSIFTEEDDQDTGHAVIFCGVMIVCLIIGVVGHITVLLSVIFYEELQRPLNVLIVNLCISQFFSLLIPIFGDIILMLSRSTYLAEIDRADVLCFFALLFSTSTSVFYGFIALNRLFSTVFEAFYAHWSWTVAWSLVFIGWLLSAIGSAFPWMTPLVTFSRDGYFILGYPWFSPSSSNYRLDWFLMAMYFFLPTICVMGISTVVLLISWRNQRLTGLALNSPRAVTLRDRFRVMLMLIVCSAIYVICYYTGYIYWNFGKHTLSANYFFVWLVFFQNVLNPYIFGLIQPQFREAYARVMWWITRKWSCRNSYGDSRRVFPTVATSAENVRPFPSVTFHVAKNNVVFHQMSYLKSDSNGTEAVNNLTSESKLPVSTSSNVLESRISEVSASKTSD